MIIMTIIIMIMNIIISDYYYYYSSSYHLLWRGLPPACHHHAWHQPAGCADALAADLQVHALQSYSHKNTLGLFCSFRISVHLPWAWELLGFFCDICRPGLGAGFSSAIRGWRVQLEKHVGVYRCGLWFWQARTFLESQHHGPTCHQGSFLRTEDLVKLFHEDTFPPHVLSRATITQVLERVPALGGDAVQPHLATLVRRMPRRSV